MSLNLERARASNHVVGDKATQRTAANPLVLMVEDRKQTRFEMKRVLELSGYRVVDTDNGQDAAKQASYVSPDLLLVDLDVPLLYGMVAARQIVKNAQLGLVPVPNEYVTRLSDYQQLEHLLDYLLPV